MDRAKIDQSNAVVSFVSAYFNPGSNYWETVLFSEASDSVGTAHMITSTAQNPGIPKTSQVVSKHLGKVYRVRMRANLRDRVITENYDNILDEVRPDFVVIGSPTQIFSLWAVRWCKRNGVPYVYISGEYSLLRPGGWLTSRIARLYELTLRRSIYNYAAGGAQAVYCLVPETAGEVAKASKRKDIVTVSLPVDTHIYRYDPDVRDKERLLRGWQNAKVTIFVGKFEQRKKIPELVQWWLDELYCDQSSRLVLVGAGDYSESRAIHKELDSMVGEAVEVHPFADAETVSALYQASDLGIFTSVTIGLQQALATGLRVFVPERPEYDHVFELAGTKPIASYSLEFGLPRSDTRISDLRTALGEVVDPNRTLRAQRAQALSAEKLLSRIASSCGLEVG
jgi:glycosyltransferase involved in cell wall biosynthesis